MRFPIRISLNALAGHAIASLAARGAPSAPTVQLDHGMFIGVNNGTINKFLGIPFAKPPVGDLRFRLPVPNDPYTGVINATSFGLSCTQQTTPPLVLPAPVAALEAELAQLVPNQTQASGEDCLTVNVLTPANVSSDAKLPVAFWIYGGAFEGGSAADFDGTALVERSITMGKPMVYVSVNYRLNAFGFLASKEVKDAGVGNIGLQDPFAERQAMRWVQKYISAFNGDPSKVTIWGQSAGSVSVSMQMLANNGDSEGLFRGAFMLSGSPIPVGDITHGQPFYDALVAETGCRGSEDTLECLRHVPYDNLTDAMNRSPSSASYMSLDLAWQPRADGKFLTHELQSLISLGSVADVPFVTGDCDDEGTGFSLSTLNITTDDQFRGWVQEFFYSGANDTELDTLLQLYPSDPSAGSPYDTGTNNTLTPQFKRIASFQGDYLFQATRRFFLDNRASKQKTWSYLNKRGKSIPYFGAAHGIDVLFIYAGLDFADYLINFVNDLDPNGPTVLNWPQYNTSNPQLLTLLDGSTPFVLSQDTYRLAPIQFLQQLSLKYPL